MTSHQKVEPELETIARPQPDDRIGGLRRPLVDDEPEHIREWLGVSAQAHVVVGVDDPADEGHHERPAAFDPSAQIGDRRLIHEVQRRGDDEAVARQVGGRMGEVDGHVAPVQSLVPVADKLHQAELVGRLSSRIRPPTRTPSRTGWPRPPRPGCPPAHRARRAPGRARSPPARFVHAVRREDHRAVVGLGARA